MKNDENEIAIATIFSNIPQLIPQLQEDTIRELLSDPDRYQAVLTILKQKGDQDAVKRLMAFTRRT